MKLSAFTTLLILTLILSNCTNKKETSQEDNAIEVDESMNEVMEVEEEIVLEEKPVEAEKPSLSKEAVQVNENFVQDIIDFFELGNSEIWNESEHTYGLWSSLITFENGDFVQEVPHTDPGYYFKVLEGYDELDEYIKGSALRAFDFEPLTDHFDSTSVIMLHDEGGSHGGHYILDDFYEKDGYHYLETRWFYSKDQLEPKTIKVEKLGRDFEWEGLTSKMITFDGTSSDGRNILLLPFRFQRALPKSEEYIMMEKEEQ